jgi:hypothetical protein
VTYAEFVTKVSTTFVAEPLWRLGQTAFNVLYEVAPDLADEIRATELDPFYLDDRLPAFYQWVRGRLE